jgi:uncharacterized protein (DUF1697 family)
MRRDRLATTMNREQTYVALLRAVNLAGKNLVPMASLRTLFEDLGFARVRTLLQSGNVVFDADPGPALEETLEKATHERLGVRTDFFVRGAAEWSAILARNPFPDEARRDPSHLVVMCLKAAPVKGAVEALRAAIKGNERVAVEGRQAYLVYPDGIGRSKLTVALVEGKLGTRGTGRNWSTMEKLAAMLAG